MNSFINKLLIWVGRIAFYYQPYQQCARIMDIYLKVHHVRDKYFIRSLTLNTLAAYVVLGLVLFKTPLLSVLMEHFNIWGITISLSFIYILLINNVVLYVNTQWARKEISKYIDEAYYDKSDQFINILVLIYKNEGPRILNKLGKKSKISHSEIDKFIKEFKGK